MACTIRYTKVGETESKSYTEAEFLALLAEGELDALRKSGKIDLSDIKDFIKKIFIGHLLERVGMGHGDQLGDPFVKKQVHGAAAVFHQGF